MTTTELQIKEAQDLLQTLRMDFVIIADLSSNPNPTKTAKYANLCADKVMKFQKRWSRSQKQPQ